MSGALGQQAKLGIAYTFGGRLASAGLIFISTVVLARLLDVRDFGIVALCFLVVDLATKAGDFGFSTAMVQQREDVSVEQVNTLFLIDLTLKLALFVGLMAATPPLARYFGEPLLSGVLPAMGVYMVVDCFSAPGLSLLVRRLSFAAVARVELLSRGVEVVIAIALAWGGAGVWSLVVGRIVGSVTSAGLACWLARWRPSHRVDIRGSIRLIRFGGWLFVRNLAYYAADNIDYLLIGRFLGVHQVGYYSKAFEVMRLPQARVTRAINAVLFSAFSRVQSEPERLANGFRKAILVTSLVSCPALVGLAVIAPEFVVLTFGEKWKPMVQPLQVMCLAGVIHAVDPYMVSLFTATGSVRLAAIRRIVELGLLLVAVAYAIRFGIVGVAAAVVAVAFIVTILTSLLLPRVGLRAWRDYFAPQIPGLLAAATMGAAAVWLRGALLARGTTAGVTLGAVTLAGALTYVALLAASRPASVVAILREGLGDAERLRERVRKVLLG